MLHCARERRRCLRRIWLGSCASLRRTVYSYGGLFDIEFEVHQLRRDDFLGVERGKATG